MAVLLKYLTTRLQHYEEYFFLLPKLLTFALNYLVDFQCHLHSLQTKPIAHQFRYLVRQSLRQRLLRTDRQLVAPTVIRRLPRPALIPCQPTSREKKAPLLLQSHLVLAFFSICYLEVLNMP